MGITITAKGSDYEFSMSYAEFNNFRHILKEVVDNKRTLYKSNKDNYQECNKSKDNVVKEQFSNIIEVYDFLCASDCEGKANYKFCKKMYNIIKDVDFSEEGFGYNIYKHKQYTFEEFKDFLKECYFKRKSIYWS